MWRESQHPSWFATRHQHATRRQLEAFGAVQLRPCTSAPKQRSIYVLCVSSRATGNLLEKPGMGGGTLQINPDCPGRRTTPLLVPRPSRIPSCSTLARRLPGNDTRRPMCRRAGHYSRGLRAFFDCRSAIRLGISPRFSSARNSTYALLVVAPSAALARASCPVRPTTPAAPQQGWWQQVLETLPHSQPPMAPHPHLCNISPPNGPRRQRQRPHR
jgi:hypothetical protein